MSLAGEYFKSLEDVQKALDSTGFVYVSKNTEYDPVTNVLKNFTLRCERFGVFKSRAKTNRATTSKKCGCNASLRGTTDKNDNGVVEYKITFHHDEHNHDKPSVDSDAVTGLARAQTMNKVAKTLRENQSMQKDNRAASSQEHEENHQVEAEVTSNDENIVPLIRQIKNLYRELEVGHAQPGFKLIEKCVQDLQEYVDKSNSDDGVVTAATAFKKNDDIHDNTDVKKRDYKDEYFADAQNADDIQIASSKSDDYGGSFTSMSFDGDFPALENSKSFDKTESESGEPQSDLQQKEIPAVGVKKVTFATDVKNTDVFKKVATSGRPRRQEKTAIGLERQSMPQNWDDRSPGQKIWSMLSWISLSKNVLKNVYDNEYKLQVKDLKKMKEWIYPFLNDRCDPDLIKDYFHDSAYQHLTSYIQQAKDEDEDSVCQICDKKIKDTATECDSCLLWFDTSCVGRSDEDEELLWFCSRCSEKK